ncbi:hypothetical protein INT44_000968 [Umbelopsis vinacea]|uniref:Macro domain-containing protein n=1 Tax=Umbelopsis vinacea TaxID=44442 RepID=A0A8H7Q9D5_9FUNG|nr:hypothetical protein INT44_000968 [Umbelopsis vinacea]
MFSIRLTNEFAWNTVDGAIHRCWTTTTERMPKIARLRYRRYNLPAKYVIHTVGPQRELPDKLKSCYVRSLTVAEENNCRTVAFPCISTGVYGYDKQKAANVAMSAVRDYLVNKSAEQKNPFDKIIFCFHTRDDEVIYKLTFQRKETSMLSASAVASAAPIFNF